VTKQKQKQLIVLIMIAFMIPMSPVESNSLQVPPCPGPGTLCSKIRLFCNGYLCSDLGPACTVGEDWPMQVDFGDDGTWTITCREGVVVGEG
jgi:hypothetical protein